MAAKRGRKFHVIIWMDQARLSPWDDHFISCGWCFNVCASVCYNFFMHVIITPATHPHPLGLKAVLLGRLAPPLDSGSAKLEEEMLEEDFRLHELKCRV